jgi:ABC-2 type transport system permease protein
MSQVRVLRYLRLLSAFARFSLAREMAFRGNFLAKVFVEVLWLGILLFFYRFVVFAQARQVAGWSQAEYLFFVGCYFALEGLIETLFLENCNEFSDLIRTGNLDLYLLQPIDEQFLISCRSIDWSTAPNMLMGAGVMAFALDRMGWQIDAVRVGLFVVLFVCGLVLAYCFLLMLTSAAVWFTRNQSLFELWWLFTSLMRYPREIFEGTWAWPLARFFTFIVPVLLVINVPATTMVRALEPGTVAFTFLATMLLLLGSRAFFRSALRRYRSASS